MTAPTEARQAGAELTPAQREFALSVISRACCWTTPCDDEEAALRERYDAAEALVRQAKTTEEIGIAMTGGAS